MKELDGLIKLYEKLGKDVDTRFKGKISSIVSCHGNVGEGFTTTLELIVKERKAEDDYGIVFSTNGQKESHYSELRSINKLFVVSDISFGDGEIIDELEEVEIDFTCEDEAKGGVNQVTTFTNRNVEKVMNELSSRYRL